MLGEMPRRILLVEDEAALADALRFALEREGYAVDVARDGRAALDAFDDSRTALVILDLMLPGMAGLDVCRAIRERSDVPVVITTAKDAERDVVAGLELGADDYVTKPYSVRELVSRVRAHLRRFRPATRASSDQDLRAGPVEMDLARHLVSVRGEAVELTPKEFRLLEVLMRANGHLLTRGFLIGEVWGPGYASDTKTLATHVSRLRKKIEVDPSRPEHLVAVRGLGYRLRT